MWKVLGFLFRINFKFFSCAILHLQNRDLIKKFSFNSKHKFIYLIWEEFQIMIINVNLKIVDGKTFFWVYEYCNIQARKYVRNDTIARHIIARAISRCLNKQQKTPKHKQTDISRRDYFDLPCLLWRTTCFCVSLRICFKSHYCWLLRSKFHEERARKLLLVVSLCISWFKKDTKRKIHKCLDICVHSQKNALLN